MDVWSDTDFMHPKEGLIKQGINTFSDAICQKLINQGYVSKYEKKDAGFKNLKKKKLRFEKENHKFDDWIG